MIVPDVNVRIAAAYKILNDTMKNDADWVRYDMVEYFLQTVGVDYGWSFEEIVTDAYWTPAQIGDFDAMQDGIIDVRTNVYFSSTLRPRSQLRSHRK